MKKYSEIKLEQYSIVPHDGFELYLKNVVVAEHTVNSEAGYYIWDGHRQVRIEGNGEMQNTQPDYTRFKGFVEKVEIGEGIVSDLPQIDFNEDYGECKLLASTAYFSCEIFILPHPRDKIKLL